MFNHSEKGMSAADGGMYFNKWNFIEVRSFSFYLKHFSFIKYTNWRAQLCRGIFKKSNFVKKIDFWSKQLNFWWKTILFLKKKIFFSLCYNKVTHGFPENISANSDQQFIYECLVLSYRFKFTNNFNYF